jgi:hypothetical protein
MVRAMRAYLLITEHEVDGVTLNPHVEAVVGEWYSDARIADPKGHRPDERVWVAKHLARELARTVEEQHQ